MLPAAVTWGLPLGSAQDRHPGLGSVVVLGAVSAGPVRRRRRWCCRRVRDRRSRAGSRRGRRTRRPSAPSDGGPPGWICRARRQQSPRLAMIAQPHRGDAADRGAPGQHFGVGDGRRASASSDWNAQCSRSSSPWGHRLDGRFVPADQRLGRRPRRVGRGRRRVRPAAVADPTDASARRPAAERTRRRRGAAVGPRTPPAGSRRTGAARPRACARPPGATMVLDPSAWRCSPPQLTSWAPVLSTSRPRRASQPGSTSSSGSSRTIQRPWDRAHPRGPRRGRCRRVPGGRSWTRWSATARAAATLSSVEPSSTTTTSRSRRSGPGRRPRRGPRPRPGPGPGSPH